MEYLTFDFIGQYRHGLAFHDYLALRKRYFVDGLQWGIPHNAEIEMDQYDNPTTHYSLVVDHGEVLAGTRIIPSTARWGDYSYMLRDAALGRMGGVPSDLVPADLVTPQLWECSRLVISENVTSIADRTKVLGLVCEGLVDIGLSHGATRLMTLSNLWLLRALRKLGYDAELLSTPYHSAEDGHKYAVMAMTAENLMPVLPKATHRSRPEVVHAASMA